LKLDDADIASGLQSGLSSLVTVDTNYKRHLFGPDSSGEVADPSVAADAKH
jgi:hypothetical protein